MKKVQITWAVLKMVLPLYLNVLQISLRDMNSLYLRAEDCRMKKFRLWMEGKWENEPAGFYFSSL